jgi:hypothetical protein
MTFQALAPPQPHHPAVPKYRFSLSLLYFGGYFSSEQKLLRQKLLYQNVGSVIAVILVGHFSSERRLRQKLKTLLTDHLGPKSPTSISNDLAL